MIQTIEAEGALSDLVLSAAREIVDRHVAEHPAYPGGNPWRGCGVKNPPLLTLLDQLIGAAEPVANAIADNCWDDCLPVPSEGAKRLADALHRIANTITVATAAPDSTGWDSAPSMSGKELV
mgnify:CR=1 FL=1